MRKALIFAILLCGALPLPAQNAPDANSAEDRIIALEKAWNQAQLLRDSAALDRLIAPRFSNTEWDGEVSDREKFLADIRDPQFRPVTLGISDVKVNMFRDTAIVTGIYRAKGTYAGRPYDHVGRFTDTWIFADDRWQCVASHTSLIKK